MYVVYDGLALFCYPPALAATKACATDRVTAHLQRQTEAQLHSEMNAAGDSGDSVLSHSALGAGRLISPAMCRRNPPFPHVSLYLSEQMWPLEKGCMFFFFPFATAELN